MEEGGFLGGEGVLGCVKAFLGFQISDLRNFGGFEKFVVTVLG